MSVTVFDPTSGEQYDVDEGQAQALVDRGMRVVGSQERLSIAADKAREEYYTSPGQRVRAAAAGVARGLTFGGSDALGRVMGAEDDLRALRDYNSTESFVGELGGGLATGSAFGAGAKAAEGAGALARIGAAAKGAAIEGAAFGAGSGVSELALSAEPVTLERAVSTIGSGALFGGLTGGAAGALVAGTGAAVRRGKQMLDDVAARASGSGDDAARAAAADELVAYRQTVKDSNPWSAINEGEPAKLLNKSDRSLRALMDDPVGLAKNPGQALKALRVQEQAFVRALDKADDISAKLATANQKIAKELGEELATLPSKVDEVVLAGSSARRYASFADVKVAKGGSVSVTRDQAAKFLGALENGEVAAAGQGSLKKLPELLEANRGLQAKIEASVAKAPAGSAGQTLAQNMLGGQTFGLASSLVGAIPFVGQIPGLAQLAGSAASKLVTEGLGKAAEKQAARAAAALGSFLKVGAKVAPAAPVLASKVLSSVRYAASSDADTKPKKGATKREPAPMLADSYKARAQEIRSQTMYDETGRSVMRPDARAKMAATLDPVRAADPVLADQMETIAARRLEFLADKLPKRPDAFAQPIGPDIWKPSDMQMRTFARYAAAVEDPHAVVDRLADGSISPEDRDAMRAVYPEMYADIQQKIFEQLPTLQKTLPYQRRIALSIFSGLPVDPAMHPSILAVLQQQFGAEHGTDGGTQAPIPQPQFGSVKAEEPTAAQQRDA